MATDTATSERARARTLGARFYRGFACEAHPDALRYTVNGRCVECAKAERKAAAPANRERDAARKRLARQAAAERPRQPVARASDFADLLG
ncbi:hypothetical protein [Bosea vestrisii]|uniref:Uncharacterized protein n=1 Tax=Bosea vestrisii TaxID=151416 RepID=A0ABW0H9J9_9HYPH